MAGNWFLGLGGGLRFHGLRFTSPWNDGEGSFGLGGIGHRLTGMSTDYFDARCKGAKVRVGVGLESDEGVIGVHGVLRFPIENLGNDTGM